MCCGKLETRLVCWTDPCGHHRCSDNHYRQPTSPLASGIGRSPWRYLPVATTYSRGKQTVQNLEGLRFGRFEIEKLLGYGGFAVVYKAFDCDTRRTVAIKLLHKHWLKNPEIAKMFVNEGHLAVHLQHPHIVSVLDVGQQYGQPYILMEYVAGRSFAELMQKPNESQLSLSTICLVLPQIASALDYLHGRGLVHRDVKPSNILVTDSWDAKLLDFGLALRIAGTALRMHQTTGTPKYMAPEQLAGKPVSPQTDIYALAVVAKDGIDAVEVAKRNEVELADTSVAQDSISILYRILEQALTTDPLQRPKTATSFTDALCKQVYCFEGAI